LKPVILAKEVLNNIQQLVEKQVIFFFGFILKFNVVFNSFA